MLTMGFWIAVMVAGLMAFSSLKYALFPDITFPVIVVNASAPFTNAAATEAKLTIPIEQAVKQLEGKQGLTKVSSSTYPGRAIISLPFEVGTKLEASQQNVEDVLQQVKLPAGATYEVKPINLNEAAVVSYAISSPTEKLPALTETVQSQIVPAIAAVPGVLKVNLIGVPAGTQVKDTPAINGAEAVVLSPGSSAVRWNGQNVLALEVVKRSDANTLEVVKEVEAVVQKLQKEMPNIRLNLASTQAEYINQATHSTIDALIEAIVLSVIVM
jgi:multidrug efflux pump subunit AcrB